MKKVAILANGGDVSGFNAVIRGIVKTRTGKKSSVKKPPKKKTIRNTHKKKG